MQAKRSMALPNSGLLKNAHLPFDGLMALSNVEGLRCPHPSSLRRTGLYVSLLGISGAVCLDVFVQPVGKTDMVFGMFRVPCALHLTPCTLHRVPSYAEV